jgi:endonuclease I
LLFRKRKQYIASPKLKNMLKKLLFVLLFCNVGFSQVVINELDCDQTSTDTAEFVELKSATPNFSLNGYVLAFFNGSVSGGNKCYFVVDLDGITTDGNGNATVGSNGVSPIPNRIIANNVIQNGADGIGLYLGDGSDFILSGSDPANATVASTTNLIDALVYANTNTATIEPGILAALGETTTWIEGTSTTALTQSIQRKSDGTYEAKIPTPRANNDGSGIIYNGILVSVNTSHKNEGDSFSITFTTQTNVTSDLNLTFILNNSTFTAADFTGITSVTIPTGLNTISAAIQITDDALNEGDEILNIQLGSVPAAYSKLNDNIEIRVVDNDFTMALWGTPLNPTHGIVTSTAPAGYYSSLEGLSGTALKQAIQDVIANPSVVRAHNYGDIWDILKVADQHPLNSNQVWMMYTEAPRAKLDQQIGNSIVGKWNREHIYCQSRGGFTDGTSSNADGIGVWLPTGPNDILAGHADAHHLRAEDGQENSIRSERNYGTDYNGPAGNAGSWHGDVARAVFYMAVRYNGLNVINGNPAHDPDGFIGDLTTLLTWNAADSSDDFEMNRNNYIYTWQVNRNPFIDHPDLADHIWGAKTAIPWSATLSTQEFSQSRAVLYPNPASDYIMVSGLENDVPIEIYAITGIKVYQGMYKNNSRLALDLSSGVYMVKFTEDAKAVTKKLIVR